LLVESWQGYEKRRKKMRFLVVNADYPEFLRWLYSEHPGLEQETYEEQMRARAHSLFGVADFYSSNLRKLGHEAYDIWANNEWMQKAWAREHGIRFVEVTRAEQAARMVLQRPWRMLARTPLRRYLERPARSVLYSLGKGTWFHDILSAQIEYYKPDVLLNQNIVGISARFLQEIRPYVRLLVGQIASPFPEGEDFSCYDLVISSLPNLVEHFRNLGIPSELNRLAFEPGVLDRLNSHNSDIPVSFVGQVSPAHQTRVRLLEHLCSSLEIRIWGMGIDKLPPNSPIRGRYMGRAWGIQMFQILYDSRITLNHHIDISESYANNMRLYEATGVGTMLITDWKENLQEIFEPGKEVVAYRSPEECAELIQYYLKHEHEREAIAHAGQERVLREHTYYQRMRELVDILGRYLSYPRRAARVTGFPSEQAGEV
jgi:spore maturation protein CgeB